MSDLLKTQQIKKEALQLCIYFLQVCVSSLRMFKWKASPEKYTLKMYFATKRLVLSHTNSAYIIIKN